jgi:hypothetical protein
MEVSGQGLVCCEVLNYIVVYSDMETVIYQIP